MSELNIIARKQNVRATPLTFCAPSCQLAPTTVPITSIVGAKPKRNAGGTTVVIIVTVPRAVPAERNAVAHFTTTAPMAVIASATIIYGLHGCLICDSRHLAEGCGADSRRHCAENGRCGKRSATKNIFCFDQINYSGVLDSPSSDLIRTTAASR